MSDDYLEIKIRDARTRLSNSLMAAWEVCLLIKNIFQELDPWMVAAIDPRGYVVWNKNHLENFKQDTVDFLVACAAMSILLEHAMRMGDRDPDYWCVASNIAIIQLVEKLVGSPHKEDIDIFPWPEKFNLPHDRSAEEYYDLMIEKGIQIPRLSGTIFMEGDAINLKDSTANRPEVRKEKKGECPIPKESLDNARRQFAKDLQSKSIGNAAEWAKRYLDDYFKSKFPWRKYLWNYMKNAIGDDRQVTYSKPRRRPTPPDLLLPSVRHRSIHIVICLDVSGSMMGKPIKEALGELMNIASLYPNKKIRLLVGDVEITEDTDLKSYIKDPKVTGGGTDMSVLIEEADKDKPDVIICITDAYTPWPEKPTRAPLIVCRPKDSSDEVPDWAYVVDIPI